MAGRHSPHCRGDHQGRIARQGENPPGALASTQNFTGAIGAKGTSWSFRDGKRTGFDPQGAVVRVIKNNQHGPVVHAGQK